MIERAGPKACPLALVYASGFSCRFLALEFFIHNLDTFYKLFPDKWVGIKNHQVIAMGDSYEEMSAHAEQRVYKCGTYQPQRCGKDKWCYTIIAR